MRKRVRAVSRKAVLKVFIARPLPAPNWLTYIVSRWAVRVRPDRVSGECRRVTIDQPGSSAFPSEPKPRRTARILDHHRRYRSWYRPEKSLTPFHAVLYHQRGRGHGAGPLVGAVHGREAGRAHPLSLPHHLRMRQARHHLQCLDTAGTCVHYQQRRREHPFAHRSDVIMSAVSMPF